MTLALASATLVATGCESSCEPGDCGDEFCVSVNGSTTNTRCQSTCETTYSIRDPQAVCEDGVPRRCADVTPGTHCSTCNNCASDEHCGLDDLCVPRAAVGEPCSGHETCLSGNCSEHFSLSATGECYIAAGAICGTDDCLLCVPADGESICRHECVTSADCDSGFGCTFAFGSSVGFCRPYCGTGNPDCAVGQDCERVVDNDGLTLYYACFP